MPKRPEARPPFKFLGQEIAAGSRARIPLPFGTYLTGDELRLQVTIVHGKKPGPCLLLTASIHGDEYNGAEIIRRMLRHTPLSRMEGTLIAVPIVNRPAFANRSRYMPDRRDLNRLFPGSPNGPLGARLAHHLITEVLSPADFVIDLHTGAINRPNLPQLRICRGDEKALELAKVFAPPVTLMGTPHEATFRAACQRLGKPALLYEGGEALRLDTPSIRFGFQGILAVMRHLGMLKKRRSERRHQPTLLSSSSFWERAPAGGIFTPLVSLGKAVEQGSLLGFVADPHGSREIPIHCSRSGLVIGRTNEAVADQGDGIFHIATLDDLDNAEDSIALHAEALPSVELEDDDHPVPFDAINDTIS